MRDKTSSRNYAEARQRNARILLSTVHSQPSTYYQVGVSHVAIRLRRISFARDHHASGATDQFGKALNTPGGVMIRILEGLESVNSEAGDTRKKSNRETPSSDMEIPRRNDSPNTGTSSSQSGENTTL
jgi:hypothetical protein